MKLGTRSTLLFVALMMTCAAVGESIPKVDADSLDGHKVSLPADFAGKPAILVTCFTKAGGPQCGLFARKLYKEPDVAAGKLKVFQIAMLAGAPRFVRPMILHGMRGGVPQPEQATFLPLYKDEKEWKQATGYVAAGENDAYLLLVNPDGTIRWSGHGLYSDSLYAEFKAHLLRSN